jgi:hypothetical protein
MIILIATLLYQYKNDDLEKQKLETKHWQDSYYLLKSQQKFATSTKQ